MSCHPACRPVSGEFHVLNVKIESIAQAFNARLHVNLKMPYMREVSLMGPSRNKRTEAIKDGIELGKRFVTEGEAGAQSLLLRLKKKKWSAQELEGANENELHDNYRLPGQQGSAELEKVEEKLLPLGEGWTRHSEDVLVHPQSNIYFVQRGTKAGQYLRPAPAGAGSEWEEISAPHVPVEHPIVAVASSASIVRKGAKLDRAVILNDITRIARLALKMPLSFVDRPACAYALFQGLRSSEAAQWCAENFHKKLLPRLTEKIHAYETQELQDTVSSVLRELDAELLRSAHPFSGCSALLALVLGDRVVVAGVGQVRAVLLPDKGPPQPLLECAAIGLNTDEERIRIQKAGGVVKDGVVVRHADDLDAANRILSAPHAFDVLLADPEAPLDENQVRVQYRKLALRVHPDKQPEGADVQAFTSAFAKMESAKETLEAMFREDAESCRELCRVLRSEVHSREGAASLLGVDATPTLDTEDVVLHAEKAVKDVTKRMGKQGVVAPDYGQAVAILNEAVDTLRRGCTPEALPRTEALMKDGIPATARAMGVRDLRSPRPIVVMEPANASFVIPTDGSRFRLGLLCGATASLSDQDLVKATERHVRRPKASALQWCMAAEAACSTAVCVSLGPVQDTTGPPAKKSRTAGGPAVGSGAGAAKTDLLRIRHILLRHQQLKQQDPMARRAGTATSAAEAEEAALRALESLLPAPNSFPKICREVSDCQSADQPGTLSGDLGWLGRGQLEQTLEEAAFALGVNDFSDILTSSRGIHIIQRLA
eukprot:gnl/TRDRNA2_/TRDRNA2_127175_c0_seq1.p1 gnl/TRDRNA2_/TRDRNA2_127175_c0~~gnl/TRDRNA2_/TRDRNA2_127175_c0_seq1.p1  ORF type:complete len:772 (-),score=134.66 gnl/TRDRNA2_/TRDRNA2_127175_c0_seq1:115-2430(-)